MCHQSQIAFYQDVSGFCVALGAEGQIVLFLFLCQGLGEAAGGELQRIEQAAEHHPCAELHKNHLRVLYSCLVVPFPAIIRDI